MTRPKGYKSKRFTRKNFKRAMYYLTLNETLLAMGIVASILSILTFNHQSDHSWWWLGDVVIYLSSGSGLPQYAVWLALAVFFFGLIFYLKLKPRFRKGLPKHKDRTLASKYRSPSEKEMKAKSDVKGVLLKFKLISIVIVVGIVALAILDLLYKIGLM